MTNRSRYAWSLFASLLVFAVLNLAQRTVYVCYDCHRPYGLPFTYWISEGFVEPSSFVKNGLAANAVVVIFTGLAIGAWWNWRSARRLNTI